MNTREGSSPSISKRVLIVEDEFDISTLLKEALAEAEYQVEQAQTASEAIDILGRQDFDCILLDIRLEEETGERVINHVRSQASRTPNIPILVMSGLVDKELTQRIRHQVNEILSKPFNIPTLYSKINKLLA